jgi:hypothetical protein
MLQAIVKNLLRVIVSDTVSSYVMPISHVLLIQLIYLNMHCNIIATASTPLSSVLYFGIEAKCQETKQ